MVAKQQTTLINIRPNRRSACRQVTLSKQTDLIIRKGANNGMENALVIEQDKVSLLPVMRVDIRGADSRPLQPVDNVADGLEVIDRRPVRAVNPTDSRRVDLQGELAGDGILP